jgi:hypothetical protein
LNISAYPSENFAPVTILHDAEAIRHLCHVDVLEKGESPGFCLSNTRCLYGDRLDNNQLALMGRQPDELDLTPHCRGANCRWREAVKFRSVHGGAPPRKSAGLFQYFLTQTFRPQ